MISIAVVSNLYSINSANAFNVNFSNGGFESSLTGWDTIGNVSTTTSNVVQASNGDIGFVNPLAGTNQAVVTTAYDTNSRIDDFDSGNATLDFHQPADNPVDSDTITENNSGNDFQTQLGLNTFDLSIPRVNGDTATNRTSKEASAIYQDITVEITAQDVTDGKNGFNVNFNWAYLTNDGDSGDLGNQDYSFISIFDVTSGTNSTAKTIEILGDSSQTIVAPLANNNYSYGDTTNYNLSSSDMKSVTGLDAGNYTYRVAFGVVDVDNFGRSSALVLDEFDVQQIPFEFSPGLGLLLMTGLFGFKYVRRHHVSKS